MTVTGYTKAGADGMFALKELVEEGRLSEESLNAAYGALPSTYIDPRTMADGPVTAVTKGTFSASYGGSPAFVQGGVIKHTPASGSSTAAYIEANAGGSVTRIGARFRVRGTTGNKAGTVTLVVPSASWAGGIGTAGLHATLTARGAVNVARYSGGLVNGTQGRVDQLHNGIHTFEVTLDHTANRFRAYVDGALVVDKVDATAFGMLSNLVIWELFEETGTSETPIDFLATWADAAPLQLIPANPDIAGADMRPVAVHKTDAGSTALTTTPGVMFSGALALSGVLPISGRVLCTVRVVLSVGAGTTVYAQTTGGGSSSSGAVMLAKNEGASTATILGYCQSIVTGTPGSSFTLDWSVYTNGGTATATALSGGASAAAVATIIPLASLDAGA